MADCRIRIVRPWLVVLLLCGWSAVASAQGVTHVIQRGETLESVAAKYHVSTEALKSSNPYCTEMFFAGQKLTIPAASAPVVAQQPVRVENPAPQPVAQSEAGTRRQRTVRQAAVNPVAEADATPVVAQQPSAPVQQQQQSSALVQQQQQPAVMQELPAGNANADVQQISESLMELLP